MPSIRTVNMVNDPFLILAYTCRATVSLTNPTAVCSSPCILCKLSTMNPYGTHGDLVCACAAIVHSISAAAINSVVRVRITTWEPFSRYVVAS